MQAYSDDFRERIMAAYATGQCTIGQVASWFTVAVSFIGKLFKRQRTSGSVAALPARGGPAPRLQEIDRKRLAAFVTAQPDAPLAELGQRLLQHSQPHRGADCAVADAASAFFALQIKRLQAAERDTDRVRRLQQNFIEAIQHEDVARFKFVDETSVNLTYTRRYGRAPEGQRVDTAVPLRTGPNGTVMATLLAQGVEAVMELDGALNTVSFAVHLEQMLGPSLQPSDVVLLDNLPVHKADGCCTCLRTRPILHPLNWRSVNSIHLRTAAARTRETLKTALDAALAWITADDAQNWFGHCGCHVH